jgi:hypothetical protein
MEVEMNLEERKALAELILKSMGTSSQEVEATIDESFLAAMQAMMEVIDRRMPQHHGRLMCLGSVLSMMEIKSRGMREAMGSTTEMGDVIDLAGTQEAAAIQNEMRKQGRNDLRRL